MSEDIFNTDNADTSDEWAQPVAEPQAPAEDAFSLDLGENAFGVEFKRIPIGQPLQFEVVDAVQKYSKAGNFMFEVHVRVKGDDWGKNRQFRQYIVLSGGDKTGKGSTMFSAIPNLAALGTPLTLPDGTALTSQSQARKAVAALRAAGKNAKITPPQAQAMVGKDVWATIKEHQEDHRGETDDEGNIKVWERIGNFLPATHKTVVAYQGYIAGGGTAENFLDQHEEEDGVSSGPMYS